MPILLKSVPQSLRKSQKERILSFFLCALRVLCENLFLFPKMSNNFRVILIILIHLFQQENRILKYFSVYFFPLTIYDL